jgi:hypothetical protein
MPPRWPRQPDRKNDPAYRRLDDRMTFAVHVAAFTAVNSGLWFVHNLQPGVLLWLPIFSWVWAGGLGLHAVYVFAIATYDQPPSP